MSDQDPTGSNSHPLFSQIETMRTELMQDPTFLDDVREHRMAFLNVTVAYLGKVFSEGDNIDEVTIIATGLMNRLDGDSKTAHQPLEKEYREGWEAIAQPTLEQSSKFERTVHLAKAVDRLARLRVVQFDLPRDEDITDDIDRAEAAITDARGVLEPATIDALESAFIVFDKKTDGPSLEKLKADTYSLLNEQGEIGSPFHTLFIESAYRALDILYKHGLTKEAEVIAKSIQGRVEISPQLLNTHTLEAAQNRVKINKPYEVDEELEKRIAITRAVDRFARLRTTVAADSQNDELLNKRFKTAEFANSIAAAFLPAEVAKDLDDLLASLANLHNLPRSSGSHKSS